ncbi:MAG: hypothetical protein ACJ75B_07025 [Flavisolibacter sp.]|jgi:hypothetical protein
MLYVIIAVFALAAVLGIILIRSLLMQQKPPRPGVYLHGLLAATGLVLLIVFAIQNAQSSKYMTSIALFVIAALGGFTLFVRDLKGKLGPVWLAVIHALVAVGGFVILLFQVI